MSALAVVAVIVASVAALLHVGFWVLESLAWRRRAVWRRFGVRDQATADALAPVFANQGYYNLFLAVGAVAGAVLLAAGAGAELLVFASAFMVGAAVVLLATTRTLWRGAAIQGLPAAVALVAALLA